MENDPIICRMCLESQEGFISLDTKLESSTVISYLEAYNFCTNLNASSTDPFPKVICIECASKLTFIYETIQKAIDSDHVMRELYKNEIHIQKVNPVIEHSEEMIEEPELSSNIAIEALKKQSDTEDNYCDDYESQENHYIEEYLIKSEDEDCQQETEFIELECSICEITFLTQTDLFEHCKTHDEKPQCVEVVVPEDEKQPPVENHPKKISGKSARMFICEVCGKCFASRQKLTQHNLVHTKEKNFPCDLCPKRFATVYRQRHHIKTSHSSEGRNFECHICHKQFVLKHTLSVHLRLHTGERPYKCPMCDKCFSQPSIMRTHVALHTGKTVKCDMCPKTFSRSSQLIVHSRSHTGERPYLCNLCPNRYRQKSHLDRHMDTHMGLKHKCNICGKEYTKKSTLTAHMFVHSEVKQFKCEECPLEFETRARYRRHCKNTHNTQTKEEAPS